jgi:fatty-acyl-CoA synthase
MRTTKVPEEAAVHSTMQDSPLSLARLLRYSTTVHADGEVVTWTGDGARRASYAEVGRRAARLANGLRSLGVRGDQRVGTFMWNNQEHLEAYLAVPAMGAVLHTLNVRLFPEQLTYIANHGEDQVILVDGTLLPLLARVLPQLHTVRHVVLTSAGDASLLSGSGKEVHAYEELLGGQDEEFDWVDPADERDAAVICYTSGTTGNPKGVAYSHRSIWLHSMQVCMGDGFQLVQGDRVLPVVPMFHVMAWGLPHAAVMVGASLVLPDRFLQAEPLARLIAAERPTFAGAVPTIWTDLLHYLDAHPTDTSSLREVVVGGSACPPALMTAYEQRHGIRIVHAWGMTETSPLGAVARPPAGASDQDARRRRFSQGRLPAAVEGRLIGPDGSDVAHDGEQVGELAVRGPWIAGSYHDDVDPDRFAGGWLRTGDVGSLSPDGFLTLTDRAKDVIKSGGEWISSVELENHLMGHPGVLEACVVGVPDEKWGERPLAAVVLSDEDTSYDSLHAHLAEKVPRWQLPERWTRVSEVPKTSVGKFDKKVLRQRYSDGELEVTTLNPA